MAMSWVLRLVMWVLFTSIQISWIRACSSGTRFPSAFVSPVDDKASTPVPPPPPISVPVWSLACPAAMSNMETNADDSASVSMNIVTFATPVSVAQPKLWAVSLYYNTLTKDSFFNHKRGVLQLLTPDQKVLVPVLGKRSGYESGYSKRKECSQLGFLWNGASGGANPSSSSSSPLPLLKSMELLPACALYIELELVNSIDAGDHVLALCRVVGSGEWRSSTCSVEWLEETPKVSFDPSTALYTAQLREEGII